MFWVLHWSASNIKVLGYWHYLLFGELYRHLKQLCSTLWTSTCISHLPGFLGCQLFIQSGGSLVLFPLLARSLSIEPLYLCWTSKWLGWPEYFRIKALLLASTLFEFNLRIREAKWKEWIRWILARFWLGFKHCCSLLYW